MKAPKRAMWWNQRTSPASTTRRILWQIFTGFTSENDGLRATPTARHPGAQEASIVKALLFLILRKTSPTGLRAGKQFVNRLSSTASALAQPLPVSVEGGLVLNMDDHDIRERL
jgi:hypothetical protein